jgi:hypothetical protein
MNKDDKDYRIQSLEQRVTYLESIIEQFISQGQGQKGQSQCEHNFDEIIKNIIINEDHLSQVLETSMEEQIISIIAEENKKKNFMKMTRELYMYKNGWIYMEDSDLKLLIETIEHKILLLHSKSSYEPEKCFDNNKIIYGLNLSNRFKKIKNKLIDII